MIKKEFEIIDYLSEHKFIVVQAMKLAVPAILCLGLVWTFLLRTPLLQLLHGTAAQTYETVSKTIEHQNLSSDTAPKSSIRNLGFHADLSFSQKIKVVGIVLNAQEYGVWGTYIRGTRGNAFWDAVAPYDVTIAWGNISKESDIKSFETKTEYRYFEAIGFGVWKTVFERETVENFMIIPANKSVNVGLSFLKRGDIVMLEGYIASVTNADKESSQSRQSAASSLQGQVVLKTGNTTIKKQSDFLYLTQMNVSGRDYK